MVFMFVSGEEEGFLGTHGLCTSTSGERAAAAAAAAASRAHPFLRTVRSVVNLEAMGNGGPSLLFRLTPDALGHWMLLTWAAHTAYPRYCCRARLPIRAWR